MPKRWTGERGSGIGMTTELLTRLLGEGNGQAVWHGAPSYTLERSHSPRQGRPYLYGNQRREGDWQAAHQGSSRLSRPCMLPRRGPPVAVIRAYGGTFMKNGKRNGFKGPIPEALSGEEPKCQPLIHRCRTNRAMRSPIGEDPGKRPRRRDPRLSPWTKAVVNGSGDRSRDPLRGELDPTGKTWEAMRESSSRKMGRERTKKSLLE